MFRLSQYLRELDEPAPSGPVRQPPGPVVIWNLIRRCNLTCKHCYSISGDVDFPGELSTAQVFGVMDDLKAFRVPVLILSGGEPLMRRDIFEISARAKAMRFYVGLSSNGTLVDAAMADRIRDIGYDYVGISLDGIGETHDRFRRKQGAYQEALNGLRLLRDRGIKVGVRFTMTEDNAAELPRLLDLVEQENFPKFYLSHLVYAGRGNKNRGDDAMWQTTRDRMDMVIARAWRWAQSGSEMEIVTGNNDADAVYLLHWAERTVPDRAASLRAKLVRWGGNSSGVNVANIDNLGNVHPDTMWWHHTLGNVKTRAFSEIWPDTSDPIMAGLKQKPRRVSGRCGACSHFDICNGNTRVRAQRITGDAWAEDPGCYLSDDEIGLAAPSDRVKTSIYRGTRHEAPLSV
ncbi:heme d1 biosynthesis radical SAM protein NirJ [Bradyrhizobium sp. CCBAU 53351]|uniref:heme d1 biosynthesis radical SAM protein NirJ n=1 Tax=Bradyrhizobium sp. CCBAU 53351 TaxID=1325114 RepID=UPI0018871DDA|nr:heme d1 biosynthesis radical SAM protein NirJ [Bradyrhizobium sp. CCBAU 53351]QOZ76289.1 heme d1 biosynthesis radical SAM protein NirJ [Bradyrhizobium sp. CCBAU 53351]